MSVRARSLILIALLSAFVVAVLWRAVGDPGTPSPAVGADRTALQTTVLVGEGDHPAISGDERYDRLLVFERDGLLVGAWNDAPDETASHPWRAQSEEVLGRGSDADVSGQPGTPPVPPRCVVFLDPAGRPTLKVLGGGTRTLDRHGATDVTVDGTCHNVAWGNRRGLWWWSAETRDVKQLVRRSVSRVDWAVRTDRVAYQVGSVVLVNDLGEKRTHRAGGGANPAISEQGHVVAFNRSGHVLINGTWQNGLGPVRDVTKAGLVAGPPTIGAGGAYVAYAGGGFAWLWTDVRDLTLLESLSADKQPVSAEEAVVSSRGNEVFYVHEGSVFARYLGPR